MGELGPLGPGCESSRMPGPFLPWLPASAESVSLALGGLRPRQHRASFASLRNRLIHSVPQIPVLRAEKQGPGIWAPNQRAPAKPFLGLLCGSWGIA